MGRESNRQGIIGERHGGAFLLGFFQKVEKPEPDPGIDFECTGLLAARASTILCSIGSFSRFHFQVKSGHSYKDRKREITKSTFNYWLTLFETQPVVLLFVEEIVASQQKYYFLPLYTWLQNNQDCWPFLAENAGPTFRVDKDYYECGRDGEKFHQAIKEEASRAAQAEGATWSTLRDYRLFPFDEAWLRQYLEFAPFCEIPKKVLPELRRALGQTQDDKKTDILQRILQGERFTNLTLAEWSEDLRRKLQLPILPTSFQRQQFRWFVNAMNRCKSGKPFTLPPFRIGEISCWRAFVTMFPHSIHMIEHVIRTYRPGKDHNKLLFAMTIASVLANTINPFWSGKAIDVLRIFAKDINPDAVRDFITYRVQRECHRSLLEAGESKHIDSAAKILRNENNLCWELKHLRLYGWPPGPTVISNLQRKLNSPTERDVNTIPFHSVMLETLEPKLPKG